VLTLLVSGKAFGQAVLPSYQFFLKAATDDLYYRDLKDREWTEKFDKWLAWRAEC
jgi:hypothetical protein